jgi:hypothetical protein
MGQRALSVMLLLRALLIRCVSLTLPTLTITIMLREQGCRCS